MTDYIPPFPEIILSSDEKARYDRNVASFFSDAVAEYSSQGQHINEDAWIYVRRRKQLNVYKSVYGTRDPQVTLLKGIGLIQGPLPDVMDGIYCDTTESLRACKTLLKYKLVDGCVMNVSEKRSSKAPYRFAGIKWFAAKAALGLSKHRDVLAYERMGTTVDANGNELAYHVVHSIDHPDWPIDVIKGVKREHQVTCYLFQGRDDGNVKCFIWSFFYNLESVAHRLAEYVVSGNLLNVTHSVDSARAKKFSMLMKNARNSKWPAFSRCHICYGRAFMSVNRPCAGCFQSVCKSCSDYRFVFHIDAKNSRPHQQRFCKLCINNTVAIDSHHFEASIKKTRHENAEMNEEVERVDIRGPRMISSCQNALKSMAKANQSLHSVADASLRSNYLDWASDSSSQGDDDNASFLSECIAAGQNPCKSKNNRKDMVSLSDLDSEDKFSPYPPTPDSHKQQTEGRNKRVQENRVHKNREASVDQKPSQRYQSLLDQYTEPTKHYPQYQEPLSHSANGKQKHSTPLPPFRTPYQPPKTGSLTRSFTVIPNDSKNDDEAGASPLMESGLGLSTFDLGVEKAARISEFDSLELSMYSDNGDHPQSRRAPRFGRTSHSDKDGFLSDLYSLSRSRIHGQHY